MTPLIELLNEWLPLIVIIGFLSSAFPSVFKLIHDNKKKKRQLEVLKANIKAFEARNAR